MKHWQEWLRSVKLARIGRQLTKLNKPRVLPMTGEAELRTRVERLVHSGRQRNDPATIEAIGQVIESHIIELQVGIDRQRKAEDVELGKLEAKLGGLRAQWKDESDRLDEAIKLLAYQRRGAMREVEDRDTSMPAGSDGVEEDGYQHGNVGEFAGRNWGGRIILYVVLILAMVADLITFRQVVERLTDDTMVLPLVIALTGATTYVAHLAGTFFKKNRLRRRRIGQSLGGWSLTGTWAGMGIGAFLVRLFAPAPIAVSAVDAFIASGSSTATDDKALLNASMMGLLYLLTGAIALAAGYLGPRSEIEQFKRADRKIRRRGPRLSGLRRDAAEADALHTELTALRAARVDQYTEEIQRSKAAAMRLKAEVVVIARSLLHDGQQGWFRRLVGGRGASADPIAGEFTVEIENPAGAAPSKPGIPRRRRDATGTAKVHHPSPWDGGGTYSGQRRYDNGGGGTVYHPQRDDGPTVPVSRLDDDATVHIEYGGEDDGRGAHRAG
ncbi:hypothetical protein [Dactylosporangium sp. NPDC005555]|uniref:hypothetical protein n=1 Tax=Dactylosporangium sp. NPDC005555 TaxID=3154889 RepID=UPI00339DAA90